MARKSRAGSAPSHTIEPSPAQAAVATTYASGRREFKGQAMPRDIKCNVGRLSQVLDLPHS